VTILDGVLRLLHPVIPFVTEELWRKLPGRNETIMKAAWPKSSDYPVDEKAVKDFTFLTEAATAIRTSRSELNVPPSAQVKVLASGQSLSFASDSQQALLLKTLCRISDWGSTATRPPKTALAVVTGGEMYVHLEGLVDLKAEAAKQQKELEKLAKYVQGIQGKLSNEQFVKNAPAELVDAEKTKLQETQDKITRIDGNLKFLGS
jgi:valyl-tRNA synthetase